MDFSGEMNKPMFVVHENGEPKFVTPNDIKSAEFKKRLASLYHYLEGKLQIKERPKVVLSNDHQNSINPFGMTGYYDPDNKSIRLYVTDRHETDILRSFAHEVVHHWQNENGTLNAQSSHAHYAQNDANLRKREMEAYLFGNILFRDWQDENRYGAPETPPVLPQPINENNLKIANSNRVKKGFERLLHLFIKDGTISTFNRDRTSGQMKPVDYINDFANKLVGSLNGQIETINNRGNWENQSDMIKEGKVIPCESCKAAFDASEQPEIAMGAIQCPFCHTPLDQDGNKLSENNEESKFERWVKSMVSTVQDTANEIGNVIDTYTAIDIINADFRANAPDEQKYQEALRQALEVLKKDGIVNE